MRTTLGECYRWCFAQAVARINMYLAVRNDTVYATLLLGRSHEDFQLNETAVWKSNFATHIPPSSLTHISQLLSLDSGIH